MPHGVWVVQYDKHKGSQQSAQDAARAKHVDGFKMWTVWKDKDKWKDEVLVLERDVQPEMTCNTSMET